MEYAEDGSQGSYHTPKLGEENVVPVPVMEPTLPPADQSLPLSDQENIPPRMVTPPPLNILVPVEEETRVKAIAAVQKIYYFLFTMGATFLNDPA